MKAYLQNPYMKSEHVSHDLRKKHVVIPIRDRMRRSKDSNIIIMKMLVEREATSVLVKHSFYNML